ncbi:MULTISPECIES: hypothetical protein [unclassified Imperialibacter]|uniref:hypothetical protein n=1 Tax=unclassified Imperialibacter TaxID=2629706 RepID=UPI0012528A85|nr:MULTISPECIES: hypothetical protein [unclassified Imperialibacter]CAD5282586.1 hypothetical protein IMPERIA75_530007 [Imperialibacter sp. 75]CAD5297452.1 hypothetical protein IMPERIA89_700007 [Imperialibacter sp. 89]VVT02893.1 hypothetical protein IMPR6_130016 [Imperialibacter sp. EC-SDR9]
MIRFVETNDHLHAYLDDKLITSQGYLNSDGTTSNDDDILISLDELGDELISNLPNKHGFFMMKEILNTNFVVTRIDRKEEHIVIEITGDKVSFHQSIWNPNTYMRRFSECNTEFLIKVLDYDDLESPIIVFQYQTEFTQETKFKEVLDHTFMVLGSTINLVELELVGFKWKEAYESDELLFCKEVLSPLFRKMGLDNLEFTHGTTEHGKDYVFSEQTRFGTMSHSAIQVKTGNLDGKSTGKLKEIIAQLDDAFVIPYQQLNDEEQKYISTFYVFVSGKISKQAIEIIRNKISPALKGSVKFLDQPRILRLVEKYWK